MKSKQTKRSIKKFKMITNKINPLQRTIVKWDETLSGNNKFHQHPDAMITVEMESITEYRLFSLNRIVFLKKKKCQVHNHHSTSFPFILPQSSSALIFCYWYPSRSLLDVERCNSFWNSCSKKISLRYSLRIFP